MPSRNLREPEEPLPSIEELISTKRKYATSRDIKSLTVNPALSGDELVRAQNILAAAKDVPALETALRSALAASFRTQPKLLASPEIKGGMEVSFKNGEVYFDFTVDAITELVAEFIGPRLAKLLTAGE